MNNESKLIVVGSFVLGALIAFLLVSLNSNKQIAELKHYSDSVTVVAKDRDSVANVMNNTVREVVAELKKTQRSLRAEVAVNKRIDRQLDSALVSGDSALSSAVTTADSNKVLLTQNSILVKQVDNLRQENLTLERALTNANAQRDAETLRADENLRRLNDANRDIIRLNAKVQNLGPTVPGWVRTSLEVVAVGGAFYAGTKVGK